MVAEKPSVARAIASFLSKHAGTQMKLVQSHSQYSNAAYEFMYPLKLGDDDPLFQTKVIVTSVRGHILSSSTPEYLRKW